MVTVQPGRTNCWLIDLGGSAAVGICALASIWLMFIREDSAGATVRDLNLSVRSAETDLLRLRGMADEQHALLTAERTQLASRGAPPLQPPVESYFESLANLAQDVGVQLRSQAPLPPRFYPALAEYRFVCELSGSLPNLARLLYAMEHTEFWTDVSYLKIDSAKGSASADTDERLAQITLSFFTAPPAAIPPTKG